MLPLRTARRPVRVVNNEFFLVPCENPYANGGSYTQSRFQVGVRLPIIGSLTVRPYYLLQSVNLPAGWDTNASVSLLVIKYRVNPNEILRPLWVVAWVVKGFRILGLRLALREMGTYFCKVGERNVLPAATSRIA